MAKISETELQRRLRNPKTTSGSTGGRTAVQKDGVWEYTSPVIYTAYADNITNRSTTGKIPSQADAAGFQLDPYDAGGELLDWRGHLFSTSIYESGDPTDYTWELADYTGVTTSFERRYTTSTKLLADVGTPTFPGTGVTWTLIASNLALPDNAYFVAEKYTIKGTTSAWIVYAAAVEENGFGVISYTIGTNKPVLGDAQWNIDAVVAVSSYTGRSYSTIKEFGYGTTVVINYNDGKLYGTLKKVSGSPAWVAAGSFIDGDLVVDGTVVADKIGANAVTAGKLLITGSGNVSEVITPGYIGAATTAAAAAATTAAAGAQSTADGKVTTFFVDSPPTAEGTGDLWIDTDDGNKLWRWNGSAWAAVQDGAIATAITNAATAQSTADGKIITFYQNDAPTATSVGDLWVDTNDGNRLYRASATGTGNWVSVRDATIATAQTAANTAITNAATAQGTADGKVTTFFTTSAPTAEGTGDLWMDTDDGNKLYRWSSSAWVAVQDGAIATAISNAATAQSTADGKIVTFYQTSTPTATSVGDMWVDTDDKNKLYRASATGTGNWVSVQDTTVADNIYTTGETTIHGGIITADSVTGLTIDAGSINAGHIDALAVTVDKIKVDGQLDISETTGSFTFKKTGYSDYGTNGVFLGNRTGSNIPVFLAGNGQSYIQVDDGGVVIVGADFADSTTITTPALPDQPTEYSVAGVYYFPISSAYATLTFKLSGAGGGGAGARSGGSGEGPGSAGGTTTIQIFNADESSTIATYTVSGGGGGGVGSGSPTGGSFSVSPSDSFFSGTGGTGNSNPGTNDAHNGTNATGQSSGGGGGSHDSYWNSDDVGHGGYVGSYSTPTAYTVTNSTYFVKITVGTGGAGGPGFGLGGRGSDGAVRISVTLV